MDGGASRGRAGRERFLILSGIVLGIAAPGLAPGRLGSAARITPTVGSVLLLAAGIQVGDRSGDLVYRYNAGSAYGAERAATAPAAARRERGD